MDNKQYKPLTLIVLDGWGISPAWGGNAITMANPKTYNYLWRNYPHQILHSFSKMVGEYNKIGNSEIGHSAIGSGTLPLQDLSKISHEIKSGQFFKNPELLKIAERTKKHNSSLHIMGLVSNGEIHSHIDHLFALLDFAAKNQIQKVYIHAITDGVDTPPNEGVLFIDRILAHIKKLGVGKIATISGRHYAMDRDENWTLMKPAYLAIAKGQSQHTSHNPLEVMSSAYKNNLDDIFVPPTVIVDSDGHPTAKILPHDTVIFFNFRADRARQMTKAFVDPGFRPFWRLTPIQKINFATLTSYHEDLPVDVIYPKEPFDNSLAQIFSDTGLRQLHIAETEKYAHVTYFFNGYHEEPVKGEDRVFFKSPNPHQYESMPQGRTPQIARKIAQQIKFKKYDLVVANIGNVDMAGHAGDIEAVSDAILAADNALRIIVEASLKNMGSVIITADHGKVERMLGEVHQDPETTHTLNPVPFIYITPDNKRSDDLMSESLDKGTLLPQIIQSEHTLADVAPTILEIFGLPKPKTMTGTSLLKYLK
jgi:2,3-bisphosphoglycerate-independent phosphoglycerate mutase